MKLAKFLAKLVSKFRRSSEGDFRASFAGKIVSSIFHQNSTANFTIKLHYEVLGCGRPITSKFRGVQERGGLISLSLVNLVTGAAFLISDHEAFRGLLTPPIERGDSAPKCFISGQRLSGKEKAHKHKQIFPVTARVGGGGGFPDRVARGLPTGGQGSKVYVLCGEPREHKHFHPGTRPEDRVPGLGGTKTLQFIKH